MSPRLLPISAALPRKSPRLLPAAVLLTVGLALSGCATASGERPEARPSLSPEEITPVQTPDSAPPVTVVDSSPGGPQDDDPLWQGLAEAAGSGDEAYLNVYLRSFSEIGTSGEVSLTPDYPDSVTLSVDAGQVHPHPGDFYQVLGTFTVEQVGDSAFTLTTVNGDEIAELNPQGPNSQQRCTASDAQDRIELAATDLSREPGKREDFRLQWGAAPEVWWGIQQTARSLRGSEGGAAGDFLGEACAPFMEGGAGGGDGAEGAGSGDGQDGGSGSGGSDGSDSGGSDGSGSDGSDAGEQDGQLGG